MDYQNTAVVARYQKEFGLDKPAAQILFEETKRFLWLCSKCDGPIAPPPAIDNGWHTFIIFTEDYANFCTQHFGCFLHHRPRVHGDPSDGGVIMRRTIAALEQHFGGFENLSAAWSYKHIREDGSCSSDSVSCAPEPSCDG
jgi:hypothetical protein